MSSQDEAQRYRVDVQRDDGTLEAFDTRLKRPVMLRPFDSTSPQPEAHDVIHLHGKEYLVVEAEERQRQALIGERARPWYRGRAFVTLLLAAAVAALALTGLRLRGAEPETIHVLVITEVGSQVREPTLAPTVHVKATNLVAGLERSFVMGDVQESASGRGDRPSLEQRMRRLGADEALLITISNQRNDCRVDASRVRSNESIAASSCTVPCSDVILASDATTAFVGTLFPKRKARPGAASQKATPEQYARYLRLRAAAISNLTIALPTYLEELKILRKEAPGFLWPYASEVSVAASLARDMDRPDYFRHAASTFAELERIAPDDIKTTLAELELRLASGSAEQVADLVARLERQDADHPHLSKYQARLAQREGDLSRATRILKAAIQEHPTLANLNALVDLEIMSGLFNDARTHNHQARLLAPNNLLAIEHHGKLELYCGEPGKAREIYLYLMGRKAQAVFPMNVGLTYLLTGDYEEALRHFRKAAETGLSGPVLTMNLADCTLLLGKRAEALDLYRQALTELQAIEGPSAEDMAFIAHCLAQVGENDAAIESIRRALGQAPDNPSVVLSAAIVYETIGDAEASARYAGRALALGVSQPWLELPFSSG